MPRVPRRGALLRLGTPALVSPSLAASGIQAGAKAAEEIGAAAESFLEERQRRARSRAFNEAERDITASGHETTDTDPGIATSAGDYSLEAYILGRDRYQIELLANLDQVPEAGAIALVTFPKPKGGSGFPARVFAIVPKTTR